MLNELLNSSDKLRVFDKKRIFTTMPLNFALTARVNCIFS